MKRFKKYLGIGGVLSILVCAAYANAATLDFVTRDEYSQRAGAGIEVFVNDVLVYTVPIGGIPNDWATFSTTVSDSLLTSGIAGISFEIIGSGPNIVIDQFTLGGITVDCGPNDTANSDGGVEGSWYGGSIRYGTFVEATIVLPGSGLKPLSFTTKDDGERVAAGIDVLVDGFTVLSIPIGGIPAIWGTFTGGVPESLLADGIADVRFKMTGLGPNVVIDRFILDTVLVDCGPGDGGNSSFGGAEGSWYGRSIRYGLKIDYTVVLPGAGVVPLSFVTRDDPGKPRANAGINVFVDNQPVLSISIGSIPNNWKTFTTTVPESLLADGVANVKFQIVGSGQPGSNNIVVDQFTLDDVTLDCGPGDGGISTNGGAEGLWYQRSIRYGTIVEYTVIFQAPNTAPVSNCQNITVELNENGVANITVEDIDGGSYDPENDPITLSIDITNFTCDNLGANTVTLTVSDGELSDTCESTVTVVDKMKPVVVVSSTIAAIWPPNHQIVNAGINVSVNDNCDTNPTVTLVSVTSDESTSSRTGAGGKEHAPDAMVGSDGSISLRAERAGNGDGRVYVITYKATDASGNVGVGSVSISVPHDSDSIAVDSGQGYDATSVN